MNQILFHLPPLAQVSGLPTDLFQAPAGPTAVVALGLFLAGVAVLAVRSLGQYLRNRRLEKLPALAGDPGELLDQACSAAGLTGPERHFLKWAAERMNLAQPTSLLLSPVLLARAARMWRDGHRWSVTRNWGDRGFERIARVMYGAVPDHRERENAPETP